MSNSEWDNHTGDKSPGSGRDKILSSGGVKGTDPGSEKKVDLAMIINMTTPGAIFLSSFMPAVFGLILSLEYSRHLHAIMVICLLLIPVFMNAAVDVINDYYDYVNGNDTTDNVVSEIDGPLAYHHVKNPEPALYAGLGFMLLAALLGGYVIWQAGWKPLLIGVIGAVIALTYSGKIISTSHLPIGEFLSGFTLGGLVPLGVYVSLTGRMDFLVLFKSIPMMMIVSQFMLSNNTCDLERDREAGRVTLSIVIGRAGAEKLARFLMGFWILQLFLVLVIWYPAGIPVMLLFLFLFRRPLYETFFYSMTHENKTTATLTLAKVAFAIAVGYPLSVLAGMAGNQLMGNMVSANLILF